MLYTATPLHFLHSFDNFSHKLLCRLQAASEPKSQIFKCAHFVVIDMKNNADSYNLKRASNEIIKAEVYSIYCAYINICVIYLYLYHLYG